MADFGPKSTFLTIFAPKSGFKKCWVTVDYSKQGSRPGDLTMPLERHMPQTSKAKVWPEMVSTTSRYDPTNVTFISPKIADFGPKSTFLTIFAPKSGFKKYWVTVDYSKQGSRPGDLSMPLERHMPQTSKSKVWPEMVSTTSRYDPTNVTFVPPKNSRFWTKIDVFDDVCPKIGI